MLPILAAVCFVGAAVLSVFLARAVRDYRAVSQLRITRIRDGRPGQFVDVWGKVVPLRTLVSPVQGKECVYFRRRVQEFRRRPGRAGHYDDTRVRTILDQSQFVEFVVDDASGKVLVAPEGADFVFDLDHEDAPFEDTVLRIGSLRFGRQSPHGATREEETCVEPGDRVHVIGRLGALNDRPGGPGDSGVSMAMRGPAAPCFIISDRSMPRLKNTLLLRVGALGFGFFGLAAIGAALTASAFGSPAESERSPAHVARAALEPPDGPPPADVADVADADEQTDSAARVEPPAEAPGLWTAEVTSVPPGATIYRFPDNELLGTTPATLSFGNQKKYVVVRITLGTQEKTGTVTASNNRLSVTFSPGPGASAAPVDAGPARPDIDWDKFGR